MQHHLLSLSDHCFSRSQSHVVISAKKLFEFKKERLNFTRYILKGLGPVVILWMHFELNFLGLLRPLTDRWKADEIFCSTKFLLVSATDYHLESVLPSRTDGALLKKGL